MSDNKVPRKIRTSKTTITYDDDGERCITTSFKICALHRVVQWTEGDGRGK